MEILLAPSSQYQSGGAGGVWIIRNAEPKTHQAQKTISNIKGRYSRIDQRNMADFSLSQQKALAVAPKISGFLSIFGSSWIVIEVLSQRTKRQNVYNRLLCAMSFFDIFNSASMMTSTWAIPKEETDVVWNVGTEKSCTIQGFLVQTSIITPICETL